jgi:hypothetical protein
LTLVAPLPIVLDVTASDISLIDLNQREDKGVVTATLMIMVSTTRTRSGGFITCICEALALVTPTPVELETRTSGRCRDKPDDVVEAARVVMTTASWTTPKGHISGISQTLAFVAPAPVALKKWIVAREAVGKEVVCTTSVIMSTAARAGSHRRAVSVGKALTLITPLPFELRLWIHD